MAHLSHSTAAAPASTPKLLVAFALATLTLGLTSCGAFFQCEGKASCPTTTTTTTSCTAAAATTITGTVYGYATNSTCGSGYLNGYTLSTGLLSPTTGAPYNLTFTPQAAVVTPANSFLYVATDSATTTGDIYGYSIGTGGEPTILNSGTYLAQENSVALDVSPDGKYLFSLNAVGTIEEYSINASTGVLSYVGFAPLSIASGAATSLKFSPGNTGTNYLVATFGTGGVEVFTYTSSSGVLSGPSVITPNSASVGNYGATFDSNNYLYVTQTNEVNVYSMASGTPVFKNTYPTGNGAHQVIANSTGTYLYVANFSDSTISGFTIGSGGALTAMSGSPFNGPTNVIALGLTSNGSNLLASGFNSTSGLQIFTIGSGGVLTLSASTGTGASTAVPVALAMSH